MVKPCRDCGRSIMTKAEPKLVPRPCGCRDVVPPGKEKISVARGNIGRNRLPGNPVTMPAIRVQTSKGTRYADRVDILDSAGNVVATVFQDDEASPAVWIEPVHPVNATHEGKKT